MSDPRLMGGVVPTRLTSDNVPIQQRGLRDGTAITVPYWEALAEEGRVFAANMGTVTTPLTFLVTAANRPDAWIRVPSGTLILPLTCIITLETATGTATEVDIRIAQNDIGNGTSTAASVGPINLRTDGSLGSACTARQLATADTTAETNPVSIYRKTWPLADASGALDKSVNITREMMSFPVLQGAATWEIYIAATTNQATGFVVMTWAELPATMLS